MTWRGHGFGLEWAAAGRPLPGEHTLGDAFTVAERRDGLLAVVADGLGHGEEAGVASTRIVAAARERADDSLLAILEHCHREGRRTRGSTLALAQLNPRSRDLAWVGIGDVVGERVRSGAESSRSREHLLSASGVVGFRYAPPRARTVSLEPGDLVLLATDGLRANFTEEIDQRASAPELVEHLLSAFARPTDDALVLAVRFLISSGDAPSGDASDNGAPGASRSRGGT